MTYKIIKVNKKNYHLFDDMIYYRLTNSDRHKDNFKKNKRRIDKNIINELKNSNLYLYAAMVDNKMVGWISIVYLPKVGKYNGRGIVYIDELWVMPIYRSNGIASALLEKAEEIKYITNASEIRLFVEETNKAAINLYKKQGLQEINKCIFMKK